ncbi:T9SS type A sorting domain-containing protein [Flavobacterium lacus]|uniref:Putative secreted protein (Por secretion system target) n=1 Tax=Flavobacterium lacus TaxID=1353778 RepID=A0A328WXR3_9FLAO|nr:Omp28-related outer membrane protein [Flavobacterium lacus]RAR50992.1 putative secreted protein (Por secretion system target) [Flavobacterium lacus]
MKKTLLSALLLTFGYASSQTFVNTTPENKKVILEEFTGVNCVFCPQGHVIANNIKNANPANVFLINIHTGNFATPSAGQPDFRTPFGTAIASQSGLTGYPAGTVNRSVFTGLSQGVAGTTAMNRGSWSNASNQTLNQSSYVNVGVQGVIDAQTRQLTVTVEVYYTGNSPVSTNKLNIALLQNNTFGPQTGGNMGNNYNHMHRLVHMITGQWGTDITTTSAGSFYTQTFNYTIPAAYNNIPAEIGEMEFVAFVTETQQRIISGNGAKPTFTGLAANDVKLKSIEGISSQCLTSLSPKVTIQNMSQTALTSLPIEYSINSGEISTFNWTGNLAPLTSTVVQLPAYNYSLNPTNTLNVSIPNDDNNADNSGSTNFNKAIETDQTNITIKITTDAYGTETTWNLKNAAGVNVAQGGPYTDAAAAGAYPQPDVNVTLPNDCYTFTINDSFGDGINSAAYGFGGYQILANGVLIPGMNGGVFGSSDTRKFGVNNNLSIDNFNASLIKFYPNPTNGLVTVSLPESATITLTDLSGKQVLISQVESGESELNLGSLSSGLYLINFSGDNFSKTDKIIIR